jgi:exodeoxyribonuclease VII large subunit
VNALAMRAVHALSRQIAGMHRRSDELRARLRRASPRIESGAARLQRRASVLAAGASQLLHGRQARLGTLEARLQALDPQAVLARGYALVTDARGGVVTDAARLAVGERLGLRFSRGGARARVEQVDAGGSDGPAPRDAG